MLDADIRDFFSTLDHSWLEKFLEHRIADKRVLRLIQKVAERRGHRGRELVGDDRRGHRRGHRPHRCSPTCTSTTCSTGGSGSGGHRHARGDMIVTRFADDFIVGFEHLGDAKQFLADLRETIREVQSGAASRQDPPDRVRTLSRPSDGRHGASGSRRRSTSWASRTSAGRARSGQFWLKRITISKRMRAKLKAGQRPAQATPASAHPRAGEVAGQRGARPSRLLRRARQQPGYQRLPPPGGPATGCTPCGVAASGTA